MCVDHMINTFNMATRVLVLLFAEVFVIVAVAKSENIDLYSEILQIHKTVKTQGIVIKEQGIVMKAQGIEISYLKATVKNQQTEIERLNAIITNRQTVNTEMNVGAIQTDHNNMLYDNGSKPELQVQNLPLGDEVHPDENEEDKPRAFADVNIASKKPTKLSSTYDPKAYEEKDYMCCNSAYVVDGERANWPRAYGEDLLCAHSDNVDTQQQWWAFDLQNVYDINVIDIFGRTDCCEEQLSNFDVEVIKPACACNGWSNLDEEDVFHCHFQATASQNITITCPHNTRGRFVRIKRKDTEFLTICEVEVYSDQVNSLIESGLSSTAYACGHIGYGYAGTAIDTSVAQSDIACTLMCIIKTACTAEEYDKETNVCTLKGECTNGTQSSLFEDNNKNVFFIQ